MRYAKEWAIRCMHEAAMHTNNCFLTLTYDDDYLPEDKSLNVQTFQLFMKRLRKHAKTPLRFYHCGEYGSLKQRPHYHALIFGYDFPKKQVWRKNIKNPSLQLYRDENLEKLWPYGFSTIGQVSFQSASYCARYITKKITGQKAEKHYDGRKPEYCTMSKGDGKTTFGIGFEWYKEFGWTDCHANDRIDLNGHYARVPRYYDKLLKENKIVGDIEKFNKIKAKRKENQPPLYEDSPDPNSRARQEEQAKQYKFNRLIRALDRMS